MGTLNTTGVLAREAGFCGRESADDVVVPL